MKPAWQKRVKVFMTLNITILFVLIVVFSLVYNLSAYSDCFVKSGTSNMTLSISVSETMIDYFKSDKMIEPDFDIFTIEENSHLLDVKMLLKGLWVLMALLVAIVLGYLLFFKGYLELEGLMLNSGLLLTVIPILLFVIPFDTLFILFHKVFFPQGNWTFPAGSVLVGIYTGDFFYCFFIKIFFWVFIVGGVALLLAIISKKTHIFKNIVLKNIILKKKR